LVLLGGPEINYPGSSTYRYRAINPNANALSEVRRLLVAPSEKSDQWLAAIALSHVALALRDASDMALANQFLGKALKANPTDPTLLLATSDLQLALGQRQLALDVATRIRPRCPSALAASGVAEIMLGHDSLGSKLYLQGLASADRTDLYRFWDDFYPIATPFQKNMIAAGGVSLGKSFIINLWARTAAQSALGLGERISIQIKRNERATEMYSRTWFPIPMHPGAHWITDTLHDTPWNALGTIYTRHGEPQREYRALESGIETLAWVYFTADGNRIFLFG
jgi:hypothetical protein